MVWRAFFCSILIGSSLTAGELQVTTWNILADSYLVQDYYPHHDVREMTWEQRRATLLPKLANFGSDVLCLQEVEPAVYQEIYHYLSTLGFEGVYAKKGRGRPDGSAIFYRTTIGEFFGAYTLYYNDHYQGPFSGNIGLFLVLQCEMKTLGFATSHILFSGRGNGAEEAGVTQVQQLLNTLDAHPEVESWIVTGDFNGEVNTPKVMQILEAGLRDSCEMQAEPTFIHPEPVRVDYIFHSKNLEAYPLLERFDWSEYLPTKEHPSDHLPVTVRFVY